MTTKGRVAVSACWECDWALIGEEVESSGNVEEVKVVEGVGGGGGDGDGGSFGEIGRKEYPVFDVRGTWTEQQWEASMSLC